MKERQARRERIANSEAGFSQNQESLDYFGGGIGAPLRAVDSFAGGALETIMPGVGVARGVSNAVSTIRQSLQNSQGGISGIDITPDLPSLGELPGVKQAYDIFKAYELGYGVFNTTGSTATLLANAPAIASGVMEPGENYKPNVGGYGNLGGKELNPFLQDYFQWSDISDTFNMAWDNDITIGQSYGLTVGRTFRQPFYDEEDDARIMEDSMRHFSDPKNQRNLYSANIGLSSEFDIRDTKMIDSATNQSWGRWITGGIDAAVAWWLAPEVLAAKVASKGIKKATTIFMLQQGDRVYARNQFDAGKLFKESGGTEGKRTAIYDLSDSLSKMPKSYVAKHDIALESTNPALVADIMGAAKTPDEAFDGLMALGGDNQAIRNLQARINEGIFNLEGKNLTLVDALTQAARRHADLRDEIAETMKLRNNMQKMKPAKPTATGQIVPEDMPSDMESLMPIFDRQIQKMEARAEELQGVIDEAMESFVVKMDRAVDLQTGVTRGNVRISQLSGVKGGFRRPSDPNDAFPMFDGTNKVAKMERKARKRYERVTGEGVWTSTPIQAGGKWGRTVRLFHAGADYMKTQKIRGFARTSDAKDSLIEMNNALETNPLLRRLTRTVSTRIAGRLDDAPVDEYMPSAQRKINEKMEEYTPEEWDEFMASGEFAAWAASKGLQTATQFRKTYYERMLGATSERERALIFDQFEEQMFYEMAESYGMPREQALMVLENYTAMKNKIATQIRDRGWYWDAASDEAHLAPQVQAALSESKDLLDFRFMDRVFRISEGGVKGGVQQARMSVSRVLSTIDSLWRPLVLMRLGYTLRNVAESNLREMAYTNSIVGQRNAKGSIQGDMKWVDLAANAGDRLSRLGRAVWYSPLRSDVPGTLRAMKKSLDDELTLNAKRHKLLEELKGNRKKLEAKKQAQIDKARREAAIKIVRDAAKTRLEGEWYVMQQITEHIADRKRFFSSIDEIILDPGQTESLEQAGWGTGLRADDVMAMVRTDSPKLALRNSLKTEPNAPVKADKWKSYLTDEERAYLDSQGFAPMVEQEMIFRALSRWLDLTQGEGGQVLRMINRQRGHFEVIHNPRKWFEDNVINKGEDEAAKIINDVRVVPKDKIDSIKGARVQVSGGILDLRPAGLGDMWHKTILDPSVAYDEVWGRLFRFSELYSDTPQAMFPKMVTMTDPMGGVGKYRTVIQPVEASRLGKLYRADYEGDKSLPKWSDEAAAEMETPIILHAYGDPSAPTLIMGDGQKRLNMAFRNGNDPKLPVTIRWMDEPESRAAEVLRERGQDIDAQIPVSLDAESKLGYLRENRVDDAAEMRANAGLFIHPSEYFHGGKFPRYSESERLTGRFDELGLAEDPQWKEMDKFFSSRKLSGGDKAQIMFLIDTARIAKAAELDPVIDNQVAIRLGDITDPGFNKWLKENGHLMDDAEFRARVEELVPLDPDNWVPKLGEYMESFRHYKGSGASEINPVLARNQPVGSSREFVAGMDWLTQNTHTVSPDGVMRVYRSSDVDIASQADGKVMTYMSTSELPGGVAATSSTYKFGLDVQPGTPYASFKRLNNQNWEQEHVLPRGVKYEYSHTEYVDSVGREFPIYKVWWDPEDNSAALMDANQAWKQEVMRPQLGNNGVHPHPEASEKVGPQLGGYAYGEYSGQWIADADKFYVKDYPSEVQGFLEYFFDAQGIRNGSRQSTFLYLPDKGGYAYGSWMKDPEAMFDRMGDIQDLTPGQLEALNDYLQYLIAEDAIYMNFDALGPAGENMAFRAAPFEENPNHPTIYKLDNGAIGPFRAHGEDASYKTFNVAWDSILDPMNISNNGYADLIRKMAATGLIKKSDTGLLKIGNQGDMTPATAEDIVNRLRTQVAYRIIMSIHADALTYGSPGNKLRGFYNAWKSNNSREVSPELDNAIEEMASLYDRRAENLLDQLESQYEAGLLPVYGGGTRHILDEARQMLAERAGKRTENTGVAVPANPDSIFPDDPRAAADIIRRVDRPDRITESGHVAELAKQYAKEKGYGKIFTPNPSKNRGYQVQVNSDQIYNGGDNIESTPAGWEREALESNDSVLNLSRMTPEQIAESVGQDVGDLTADDKLAGTVAGFSFYQGRKPKLTSGGINAQDRFEAEASASQIREFMDEVVSGDGFSEIIFDFINPKAGREYRATLGRSIARDIYERSQEGLEARGLPEVVTVTRTGSPGTNRGVVAVTVGDKPVRGLKGDAVTYTVPRDKILVDYEYIRGQRSPGSVGKGTLTTDEVELHVRFEDLTPVSGSRKVEVDGGGRTTVGDEVSPETTAEPMDQVLGKLLGGAGFRNVKQLPHEVRARLAIRMQNEGYSYIALPNGRRVSQSELLGNDDVGASYGAAIAKDEVDVNAQGILAKDEEYGQINLDIQDTEAKIRAVESRLSEREAEIKKLQEAIGKRRSKRSKEGGTTFSGSQVREKLPYTVWRDGTWHQGEVEVESAFGPQGSLYRQLISSNDRVAADMMGLGELTYRGMRTTRKEVELTPYTEDYWRGLSEYGNKMLSNDPITEGIMDGLTDDEIIDVMFNTARGRSAIRNLDDFKEFRKYVSKEELAEGLKDEMVALINQRRVFMDEYFNDSMIREIMRDEKKLLTADIMRDRLGMNPNLKPFLGHATEYERSLHRRTIGSIMHVIGTMPEDKLARSPFFRNRYRESMQEQISIKAQQGQDEFGPDELNQMSRIARREALQILNDTLYTIQRVSTFADSMRLILPFFPAWASAARFWMYQVPKKHPENLVRYAMVDSAPDRAGWSVDDENNRVEAPSGAAFALARKLGSSEAYSIAFQVADEDLGWFEKMVGPQSNLKIPKGSIDMMLQGEFPLIPTASPLVTVPVSFIGAMRPDILTAIDETGDFTFTLGDDEEKLITNGTIGEVLASRVMPFGEPTREKDFIDAAIDQYAPAWLNKVITATRGESSADFAAVASEIHRSRMTDYDLNDKTGPAPKYADSVSEARQFMIFRGLINATAPFSPMFQSKYQFYIDAWRDIQREGDEKGWSRDDKDKMFIDMYGREFFRYTKSKSNSMSGMAPDLGEYEAVTKYPELTGEIASIGTDAKFLSMLTKPFNQGEGFNSNVYAWQMNRDIPGTAGRTYRGGIPERQLEIQSQMELGWYDYNRSMEQLEALADQKGYSAEVLKKTKAQVVDQMAMKPEYQDWYAEFQEISGGRWVNSVNALYLLLDNEKFMKDNAPPEVDINNFKADYASMTRQQQYVYTLQEFVKLRDFAIGALEQQKASGGSGNIDAKQNLALSRLVDDTLNQLYMLNTDFADMHRRYFGGDKYERTEDTAVTND